MKDQISWFILILLNLYFIHPDTVVAQTVGLKDKRDDFLQELTSFVQSRDANGLESIEKKIHILWDGKVSEKHNWRNRRELRLELWLHSINIFDRYVKEHFNPELKGMLNVIPEIIEGGLFVSGMDPKDIQNEKTRLSYIKALDENRAINKELVFQSELGRKKNGWLITIIQYIDTGYELSNDKDYSEVNRVIDKVGLEDNLRDYLLMEIDKLRK